MKAKSRSKRIELIFVGVFVIIIFGKWLIDYFDNQEIKQNMLTTEGVIVDYFIVGTASPHVVYEYFVDGVSYKEQFKIFSKFAGCEDSNDCIGRKFVVYYSKKSPEKSEIDLENEIK